MLGVNGLVCRSSGIREDSVRSEDGVRREGGLSFLQQNDVNVVVDALQKQLALEADQLLPLGRLQRSHQCLEDIGAAVVIEQDPELHNGLTIAIFSTKSLNFLHQQLDLMFDIHYYRLFGDLLSLK